MFDAMSEKTGPPGPPHTPGIHLRYSCSHSRLPHPYPVTPTSTSTKRPIDHASDTSGEPSSPTAKTSRHNATSFHPTVPAYSRPRLLLRGHLPSLHCPSSLCPKD
ncbi:hypothetical protein GWK47_050225 [Chionoecetes opilio]|uniref:Uncharacterized protein n=1 Tax=Chionoecetes opilio TaxID=41210 RepID=A0A8J5CTT4_CHIOP|nr:hypothetical protein GWK47_050225 [Chionoecetes opilio]